MIKLKYKEVVGIIDCRDACRIGGGLLSKMRIIMMTIR